MTPGEPHEKQTVGTVTASHKMLTLQALSSSLNAGTAKRGCLGRGKAFGVTSGTLSPKTAASIYTLKAFSPKKGLVFAVNGASPPPPPPAPRPRPPPFLLGDGGGFTENPRGGVLPGEGRGGGGRGVYGEFFFWGGEEAPKAPSPIYRENEPPFWRKRLIIDLVFAESS